MSDALRDVFKNEVIRASAGTGKTFQLSNRFLRLLASGVECETILATTFTRKGAGEILDRIVQRLARAATSQSEARELASQLEWELDQTRVQELLRELIRNLHRLQIGTLDAFFYRIAQSFRLELGLPTQWQIVDEQQIEVLHNKIIHEILRDKTAIDLLHLMTKGEAQRRIADLIRVTVKQLYQIRVQSDAAAWDRLQRPKAFSPATEFTQLIAELRSIKYPHKSQLKQIEKEISLIEQRDWLELAQESVFSKVAQGINSYYKPLPDECVRLYHQLVDHCRGIVIDMLIRKNRSTFELLDAFGQRLENEKTETGQLRFEDITIRLEQFIRGKETDEFAFRLDHNVNHLLLDEFQDTSISQWNVVEPFAQRTTEDDSQKSFFCVGDLKQAIFGWRGGVAEIFDTVECNLSNMSIADPLVKSFRSSPVIIESVNRVFGNLSHFTSDDDVVAQAVSQWSQRFETHETQRQELPGYFSLEFASDSDEKHPNTNSARNVNTLETTVQRIKELHDKMPDRTIGVLVRKNETIGQLIFKLQDAGVAASEEGGNPLTDSAAVEIMLALLTLADHPGDSVARFHISHSPLASCLNLMPETPSNKSKNARAASSAAAAVRKELNSSGYGSTIEKYARLLATGCTKRELSRLQQLAQEAFNYENSIDQTRIKLRPSRFVNHIRHEYKASDESSAQVRVMTIHQSKGLEFDVVVLPMLLEHNGWFTHQSPVIVGREHPTSPINLVCRLANANHRNLLPKEFQEAFDENRRREVRDNLCVLYVAMTRAIHATHVVMSYGCKPDKSSSASVVLATLHPGDRKQGVVFSLGDQEWYQRSESKVVAASASESNEFYLPHDATISAVTLANSNPVGRAVPSISPSGLEGGDEIAMSSIFSTIANDEKLTRGSIVHASFELISWLDEGVPGRADLEQQLKSSGLFDENSSNYIDQFLQFVKQPELVDWLSRHSYRQKFLESQLLDNDINFDALRLEVFNERPFAVYVDDHFMKGVIDRLIVVYKGDEIVAADIIDFKTDDISASKLQDRTEYYRPQLEAYRRAVSIICNLPIEHIAGRLVFVECGRIVTLQAAPAQTAPTKKNPDSEDARASSVKPPKFCQKNQLRLWSDE